MNELLRKSKFLILIAVFSSLLASGIAFIWGAVKTITILATLVMTFGKDPLIGISLIELMDTFLIATVLLIFAVGIYELFIDDLELPAWLEIRNLHDLKVKLGSVVILIMAITFLKHFVEWRDPQGTYYFGLGAALVSASIIAFIHFGGKE